MLEKAIVGMGHLPSVSETMAALDTNTTSGKLEMMVGLLGLEIVAAFWASTTLEGTVRRKHEKALAVAGLFLVTALNVLVNTDMWK